MKNNTLYQYQGGGYFGCVWEWNFFFIDKDGVFHDIFSSGSSGIADLKAAEKVWDEADDVEDFGYTYCLDDPDNLDELAREISAVLILGLVKWFEENQNNEVYAICGDCGCRIFDLDEIKIEGTDVLCYECHSLGVCNECWDYAGVDDIVAVDDVALCRDCHSSGVCAECLEYAGVDEICYDVNKIGDVIDFSDEVLQKLAENLASEVHHCEYCLESLAQYIDNGLQKLEN